MKPTTKTRPFRILEGAITFLLFLGFMLIPAPMSNAASGDLPASAATNIIAETNASAVPPLERKVSLKAQKMPLKDALAEMCRQANIELDLDTDGLKLSGVSVDMPVTMQITNEPLQWAFARIIRLVERQGIFPNIYQEIRGGKLLVSSIRSLSARQALTQPAWLNGYGSVGNFDADTNILSIYAGAKADDEFLAKLKTLPKLRELDIEATKFITPAGLAHLAELPALEKLSLYEMSHDGAGLGNDALPMVSQIKTLRDLRISYCSLTDDGVRALEGMTQLTALNLSHNRLTDAAMKSLASLTNLQSLDLSDYPSTASDMRLTDAGMKQLSQLKELRELSLGGLKISGQTLAFPQLQSLILGGDLVTDAALDSIVQCRELRQLSLQWTRISDTGMERIAGLKELRRLSLSSEVITDAGVAQLRSLPKLEHMELIAARVSDASLRSLAEIKSLTRLDLFCNGRGRVNGRLFTMDGLSQLKALPDLRELWITGLELPEGYLGLRELKQLRGLTLFFCNVKDDEEELLKAAMPDTYVSASSGSITVFTGVHDGEPIQLPDASVRITGRAVDDVTGRPLNDCTLEFGTENPDKPGVVIWGVSLPGQRMEVAGNSPQDKNRFWGESFRPGKVWARLLAGGHQPTLVTPKPVEAPLRLTNLVVRLKHGGDFHGIVHDYQGHPLPGIRLYLADKSNFYLRNGKENSFPGTNNVSVTDASGRFLLSGGNGTEQKIVAATADGHLFQVVPDVNSSRNLDVTLPQPATLIIRYDISDDIPEAEFGLNFRSEKLDLATWKNTSFGVSSAARNGTEVTLTNLSPGTYQMSRRKTLQVGKGSRFGFLNWTDLDLKPGKTKRVDINCPVGQTVRGQVTGIAEAKAFGAYIYVFSDHGTNMTGDWWQHQQPNDTIDMLACGADGQFQTARIPPGAYNLVAMAFTEPRVYSHNMDPEYFGVAKVTVTADAPTPPIKIALIPCTDANRAASK